MWSGLFSVDVCISLECSWDLQDSTQIWCHHESGNDSAKVYVFLFVKWSIVLLSLFSTKGIKFFPMHFDSHSRLYVVMHILTFDKHLFIMFVILKNTQTLWSQTSYLLQIVFFGDAWLHKPWRLKAWPFIRETEKGRQKTNLCREWKDYNGVSPPLGSRLKYLKKHQMN